MILTRNSDVRNHLSARWRAEKSPHLSVSQPDATGFSEGESVAVKVDPSKLAEDFHGEHSSQGIHIVPTVKPANSASPQVPDIPGSTP
jgi:hypothetical protein